MWLYQKVFAVDPFESFWVEARAAENDCKGFEQVEKFERSLSLIQAGPRSCRPARSVAQCAIL
jgi:hypothetical protein